MKYASTQEGRQFPYLPFFLYFVLVVTVEFHSEILLASSINVPDTMEKVIPRQQTIPFHTRSREGISPGDTLVMYPKRELSNGFIVDYPPEQHYEARIIKGKKYAAFVFPHGITSTDTSGVVSPVKLCVGMVRAVELRWEIYALRVDTSNDHFLRSMDIHEMIRRLSAPTNRLKSLMMVYAGYLQLKLGKYEDARVCLREAIVLDSSQKSSMYYDMACSYARENKAHDALQWLRRAFESGYDKYIHALRDDSDLVSIRLLPEFREIVTARFAHKRAVLLDTIKAHPNDAGQFYFQIGATYLEQADIDSFFVAFEIALKKGFYPRLATFIDDEYSSIKKDPRLDSLLEKYAEQNPYRISSEFDAGLKPRTVRRIELNQNINDFRNCPKLVEIRIIHSARGELSPEIADMRSLRILRYVECGFKNFQSAITKCTALDTLTSDKGLARTLPVNFGDLVHLKQLKLCNGRLESLPRSFTSLTSLADLSFSGNSFSSLPKEILSLTNLESLDISGNSISEIPGDLQKLSSLKKLNLADNRITLVPNSIGQLRQLKELDLSINCLSSLPEEITLFQQLEQLDLSFNELKKLPRGFGNLQSLRILNVYGNQLDTLEIESLRTLLPHCRIIGDQQNVFQKQIVGGDKSFHDTTFGISFSYPAVFSPSTKRGGEDSSEYIIELSHENVYEQEIDSITYKFPTDATLTIRLSWDRFDAIARDAGFEENERLNDTSGRDESDNTVPAPWVSEGRQGMEEDVSVLSCDGWRGFFGTNFTGTFGESDSGQGSGYQGLHEFYVAVARKKLDHGMSVSISFFNENYEDDDAFHTVLSSFQFQRTKEH